MWHKVAVFALILTLLLTLAAPASATTVKGQGILFAKGNGVVKLKGKGKVHLKGNGILIVRDLGGDAKIKVKGYGKKFVHKDGTVGYGGFYGVANISGSHIKVEVKGIKVKLQAKGEGQAYLKGCGTYRTKQKSGRWSRYGKVVKF